MSVVRSTAQGSRAGALASGARGGAALVVALICASCATTGATFRSGVGDTFVEHPPYYAGSSAGLGTGGRIGVVRIHYQAEAGQPAQFGPPSGPGSALAALVMEMNRYLDSLASGSGSSPVRLVVTTPADLLTGPGMVAPDIRFGCITELDLPGGDCVSRGDSSLGRAGQRMKLAVGRPSPSWIAAANVAMDSSRASHLLVVTLEVGQYLMKQRGLAGRKAVELGTGHEVELPWLTSLETPVAVLQLTGALVGRDGRAVRIGAEGIVARRTRLSISALGAQELLTEAEIAAVRTLRRDDLAGAPIAWQEAMRQLVVHLTR